MKKLFAVAALAIGLSSPVFAQQSLSDTQCVDVYNSMRVKMTEAQFTQFHTLASQFVNLQFANYLVGLESPVSGLIKSYGKTPLLKQLDEVKGRMTAENVADLKGQLMAFIPQLFPYFDDSEIGNLRKGNAICAMQSMYTGGPLKPDAPILQMYKKTK